MRKKERNQLLLMMLYIMNKEKLKTRISYFTSSTLSTKLKTLCTEKEEINSNQNSIYLFCDQQTIHYLVGFPKFIKKKRDELSPELKSNMTN